MSYHVNTVIIPHRGRHQYLIPCLASLRRSLDAIKLETFMVEVIIVHNGPDADLVPDPWAFNLRGRVIVDHRDMPVFNKSILLNMGIEAAQSSVITFLDADAIVGPRFFETPCELDWSAFHRCCYRVRYVDEKTSREVVEGRAAAAPLFDTYEQHALAYEGWGNPERNFRVETGQPWGNSQFSIHRRWLGGRRFDEGYVGRGFEDLDLLKRMHDQWGDSYRGHIVKDADHAMLHLKHDYTPDWFSEDMTRANLRRFQGRK